MKPQYRRSIRAAAIVVTAGLFLFSAAHAETLRGRIVDPDSGESNASVVINVRKGRIQQIAISFRPVSLLPPWEWYYDNPYTHEGVEGYLAFTDISPSLTATTFARYSSLRGKTAKETQREKKVFTRQGIRTTFVPENGDEVIFIEDDLAPHSETFAGEQNKKVKMRSALVDGKIVLTLLSQSRVAVPHPFELFDLVEVQFVLAPLERGKWQLEFRSTHVLSHTDHVSGRTIHGDTRLRGRASIDARLYASTRESRGK